MRVSLAPTGAGMVIWNPTNEDIGIQYAGISFTIVSGEKREFEINCANHILNSFGARGLTSLKYGDEANEEKIGKDGIDRNLAFKRRQITVYNQQNENRKHMNLGYQPPTETIKKYAIELGLKLLEPFTVRDEERAGITKAGEENEVLRKRLEDQDKELSEIKSLMLQMIENSEPKKSK
jgi:hypothetical protein